MQTTFKILLASLFALTPNLALAEKASHTTDGITVSVEATPEKDGRILVHCVMTNDSNYQLASAFPHSPSMAFQITLLDATGRSLPIIREWARGNAQPTETNLSEIGRISLQAGLTHPGDTRQFDFHLEEAYGELVKKGRTLQVIWLNTYAPAEAILTVEKHRDDDGKIIPEYKEPNHFPGRQSFTVSLTLPGHEGEAPAVQQEVKPPVTQQPKLSPVGSPDRELKRPVAKPAEATQNKTWRWWWSIFLLPVFLVGWLIIRQWKSK